MTGQSMMDEQTVDQFELRHKIRRGESRGECRDAECRRSVYAKGLCKMHYERRRRERSKDA